MRSSPISCSATARHSGCSSRSQSVLTWGNQHGIRERILASGFDLHLSRPITAEEIDHALRDKLRHTA
jgi:hypothetical protein